MIFVINNENTSSILRGNHIAEALGVPVYFADLNGTRNEDVVFVKEAARGLVLDALDRGNRIILDVIDLHCYRSSGCPFADLVEVLIVPNRACIEYYAKLYPIAKFAVIPHQWDRRISGTAQQYKFTPAYIGKPFNLPLRQDWGGTNVFEAERQLWSASKFNLHLCLQRRDGLYALLKPATKISTAAAVLANVLTYRDPSAVELLGVEYPFYVDRDETLAIRMVREAFGGKEWKRGREKMKEVREKTSLQAVAGLYSRLANHDPAMLIEAEAVAA